MSSNTSSTPTARSGLSLYANLLDPSSTTTDNISTASPVSISRAPVLFKRTADGDVQQRQSEDIGSAKKQQINAAALRFLPTKRPQNNLNKPKAKAAFIKVGASSSAAASPVTSASATNISSRAPTKTTLADWTGLGDDDDVNGFYGGGEKRQRGGRKKRKRNKEESAVPQNWDDIYDPSRPNSYEEYKNSDEKILEVREWKDRLYAHRMGRVRRGGSSDMSSEDEDARQRGQNKPTQFAPPPSYSFAPPPTLDADNSRPASGSPAGIPDDPSGEDAYARRLRLSQQKPQSAPLPSSPSPPPAPPKFPSAAEISRVPVRYTPPPPPNLLPPDPTTDDIDAPRSSRPGQTGFAERILSRYGWKHGTGLGATASGITAPLRVQVEKAKRKSDAEGGGLRNPGGARGKIIGGKRREADTDAEEWSEVVRLRGMLKGVDIDAELRAGDGGGVVQEIGEECSEKYGRVERVFVHRAPAPGDDADDGPVVFVRFISTLSAVRAVKALEGRAFGGNVIRAGFWSVDSFETGVYE